MIALTLREREIAGLVAAGVANKNIAFALHLSTGTIKEYMHHIFRKLGMSNRTQLAVWWISGGKDDEPQT